MRDRDSVIIETSAVLITLMFVILSIWTSKPPESAEAAHQLETLVTFAYGVGLLFSFAGLAGAVHMFGGPMEFQAGTLEGIEQVEIFFFMLGMTFLVVQFLFNTSLYFQLVFAAMVLFSVAFVLNKRSKEGKPQKT